MLDTTLKHTRYRTDTCHWRCVSRWQSIDSIWVGVTRYHHEGCPIPWRDDFFPCIQLFIVGYSTTMSRSSQIPARTVVQCRRDKRYSKDSHLSNKHRIGIGRSSMVLARVSLDTSRMRITGVSWYLNGSEGIVKVEAWVYQRDGPSIPHYMYVFYMSASLGG